MKKLILSVAALAASLGPALAADLPVLKAPPVVAPPPPLWTGFYVGLNIGGAWSGDNPTYVSGNPIFSTAAAISPATLATAAFGATASVNGGSNGGFIGGGQVGYNYQFNNLVVGLEADIQGLTSAGGGGTNGDILQILAPATAGNFALTSLSVTKSLDYLGTVRGRIGYLLSPTLLLYGTGGLAYGGVNSSTSIFQSLTGPGTATFNGPYFSSGSYSDTRVGWTAGAGLEWLFLPNWSAKVEYLYFDLGSVTYGAGVLANVATTGSLWNALAPTASTRFNGNIVRAGVNYHFNWVPPAPVVAKY